MLLPVLQFLLKKMCKLVSVKKNSNQLLLVFPCDENLDVLSSNTQPPLLPFFKVDEDLVKNSGKFLLLDRMLPELKKRGHKVKPILFFFLM